MHIPIWGFSIPHIHLLPFFSTNPFILFFLVPFLPRFPPSHIIICRDLVHPVSFSLFSCIGLTKRPAAVTHFSLLLAAVHASALCQRRFPNPKAQTHKQAAHV